MSEINRDALDRWIVGDYGAGGLQPGVCGHIREDCTCDTFWPEDPPERDPDEERE